MARNPPSPPRKRRTREHVIADLSANHVERFALLCGFSVERIRLDYGIDLIVHKYNRRGEIENGRILIQLKATDRIKVSTDGGYVHCRLETADIDYWIGEAMPVILVQYDAAHDRAYWLHVQEVFNNSPASVRARAGKWVTMCVPRTDVLNRQAMRKIAGRKNKIVARMGKGGHRGS